VLNSWLKSRPYIKNKIQRKEKRRKKRGMPGIIWKIKKHVT